MLSLKPVQFLDIQQWFCDYQKKSKNYDMPPEEAHLVGIYRGTELIGYFIVVPYKNGTLEINQGYLKPEARHKNLSKISMGLLEEQAKKIGITKIALTTNRAVGSYIRFMHSMNYNIEKAIFSKEVK
jgi:hypothetical protein